MQLTRDPTTGESFARFDIRDYGATAGDGTDDARAIQAAIDAARDFGPGARVVIEGGEYLSNSALFVHSHTYLHLDESATLLKGYVSGAAQAFGAGSGVEPRAGGDGGGGCLWRLVALCADA